MQKTLADADFKNIYYQPGEKPVFCYRFGMTVYEEVFDRLDDKNKKLLVEDALSLVSYDSEKDKINVGAPQIVITVGGRMKYGDDLINAAEIAVTMIQEIEEEKKAQKEAEKAVKKTKKNG